MKIVIQNCTDLDHNTGASLLAIFPAHLGAKLLNFGQGEGQVEVAGTTWGVYFGKNGTCLLQFEEGAVSWPVLQKLVAEIMDHLSLRLAREIAFLCEGCLDQEKLA